MSEAFVQLNEIEFYIVRNSTGKTKGLNIVSTHLVA